VEKKPWRRECEELHEFGLSQFMEYRQKKTWRFFTNLAAILLWLDRMDMAYHHHIRQGTVHITKKEIPKLYRIETAEE
jgi:hypothetical protein